MAPAMHTASASDDQRFEIAIILRLASICRCHAAGEGARRRLTAAVGTAMGGNRQRLRPIPRHVLA
jgi:hypothetical protein